MSNLGLINYQQDSLEKALSCYRMSQQMTEEMDDLRGRAVTLINIGALFTVVGPYDDDAFDHYESSQEIFESIGDRPRVDSILNDRGWISCCLEDRDTALDYHLLSYKLYEGLRDKLGLA